MNSIVVNYVQLICFTIFMRNNVDCDQLMSQVDEVQTFKVSTCIADCLRSNLSLSRCYTDCNVPNKELKAPLVFEVDEFAQSFDFTLFCRESSKIVIEFHLDDNDIPEGEKFVYLIKIQETDATVEDYKMFYVSIFSTRNISKSEIHHVFSNK